MPKEIKQKLIDLIFQTFGNCPKKLPDQILALTYQSTIQTPKPKTEWEKELIYLANSNSVLPRDEKREVIAFNLNPIIEFISILLSQSQAEAEKRGYEKGRGKLTMREINMIEQNEIDKKWILDKIRQEEREKFRKILAGIKLKKKFDDFHRIELCETTEFWGGELKGYNQAAEEINKKIGLAEKELTPPKSGA